MASIERDGENGILLAVAVTQNNRAKEVPGARYDAKRRAWKLPLSWSTCVAARGVFGTELAVGPELTRWATEEFASRVGPATAARGAHDADGAEVLFPYQRAGVQFLRTAGSALLADEMGLGKTVQTISALEADDLYPALIVCPNSVKAVWSREYAKWAPDRSLLVAPNGTVAATKIVEEVLNGGADVLVINWEAVKNLSRLAGFGSIRLAPCSDCDKNSTRSPSRCERHDKVLNKVPWRAVVADEAHRAKEPESKQTRALWAVGDKAERRVALTGTPIANSPEDLWSLLRFVAPEEYPSKWPWIERYAKLVPNIFSGGMEVTGLREEHRAELDRVLDPRMLRRTKKQVLPQLPPKTYERRDVVLTPKQRKAYDAMKKSMVAQLDDLTMASTDVLTNALRLRQLASAYIGLHVPESTEFAQPTLDNIGRALGSEADARLVLTEPSSKLDALEEILEDFACHQVVVFAESRQLIDLAFARIANRYTCGKVTGRVKAGERSAAVENFQRGDSQVLLATVGAGGEGITLTAADTAIYLQRPWSQVLNLQSEDRLHRIGQEAENVLYIDLVATDTIEEHVFEVLAEKADRLEELVQDRDNLRRWLA